MNIQEKVEKTKLDRSLELNKLIAVNTARDNAIEEDNLSRRFLSGDGTNEGILYLFYRYYKETNIFRGTEFLYPSIASSSAFFQSYENQFQKIFDNMPVTDYVDDEEIENNSGFYAWDPSDPNKTALDDLNYQSEWLNKNGNNYFESFEEEEISIGGLEQIRITLDEQRIGSIGEDPPPPNCRGPGIGLVGKRNEQQPEGEECGFVNENYYQNPEKNAFLNEILNYANAIENNYITFLLETKSLLERIQNGENEIFEDFEDMKEDVHFDDIGDIDTLISQLNDFIGTEEDGLTSLMGYYNWFNNASGSEESFDNNLENLRSFLTSGGSAHSLIRNRIENNILSDSSAVLGNISGGSAGDFTGLRKQRNFWIETRILKQKGSFLMKNSISMAADGAIKEIGIANSKVEVLEGQQYNLWIPKPILLVTYLNPKLDDEGLITERRVGVVYNGQQHATKYLIFRKDFNDVDFSNNDFWDEGSTLIGEMTARDIDTNFVKSVFMDNDVEQEKAYIYRVRTIDEINDPSVGTTGSAQSDIFDEYRFFNFSSSNDRLNITDEDFKIDSGNFILIKDSGSLDGVHLVTKKEEEYIKIQNVINGLNGKIFVLKSMVMVL